MADAMCETLTALYDALDGIGSGTMIPLSLPKIRLNMRTYFYREVGYNTPKYHMQGACGVRAREGLPIKERSFELQTNVLGKSAEHEKS
jgi:hypothetical protein